MDNQWPLRDGFKKIADERRVRFAHLVEKADAVKASILEFSGPASLDGLREHFEKRAFYDASIESYAMAVSLGASSRDLFAHGLTQSFRLKVALESPMCEILRCLLAHAGPDAVLKPLTEKVRIHNCIGLLAQIGDPIALGMALSMDGVDPFRLAGEMVSEGARSPLNYAAVSKSPSALDCCRMLVELGAPLDEAMNFEDHLTPLYFACQEGHADICAYLVAAGARLDLSYNGKTVTDKSNDACKEAIESTLLRMELQGAVRAGAMKSNKPKGI